jgi:hypothetical protein
MVSSAKSPKILISILLVVILLAIPVSAQNDADDDGVRDGDDECPDTADGATVDADGCSDAQRSSNGGGNDTSTTDSDADGVIDDDDECFNTEEGVEVNPEGCAAYQLDTDRDGVPNEEDECPDTPHSEKNEVNRQGCTPFMDETLAESVPIVGRISKGNAISAGTVSMVLGVIGWAWRASRVIGVTGGSGKRLKKKYLTRIKKAKSNVDLQIIRKELNKVNDKGKLPDGAYADLMTTQEQRSIALSNQSSSGL